MFRWIIYVIINLAKQNSMGGFEPTTRSESCKRSLSTRPYGPRDGSSDKACYAQTHAYTYIGACETQSLLKYDIWIWYHIFITWSYLRPPATVGYEARLVAYALDRAALTLLCGLPCGRNNHTHTYMKPPRPRARYISFQRRDRNLDQLNKLPAQVIHKRLYSSQVSHYHSYRCIRYR